MLIAVTVLAVLPCPSTHGGTSVSRARITCAHAGSVTFWHDDAEPCRAPQKALIIPTWLGIAEKPMTVAEMARMGGIARAKAHSKAQLRKWGKEGGRPVSLDRTALARLEALLRRGKSQAECAAMFGVSVRTVGRLVARMRRGEK